MRRTVIVLDDDPTGVQTVHRVPVYTDWGRESVRAGFMEDTDLFFILTNSRSFSEAKTVEVHRAIAETAASVAAELGKDFLIVCRGDSTLRGHYLLEPETVEAALNRRSKGEIDAEIICPCFFEGGRVTIDNIHCLLDGETLVPVGETEFSRDRTFGYSCSHLGEYVEEKTKGRVKKEDCGYVSVQDLEADGQDRIFELLIEAKHGKKIIVNASQYHHLTVFCEVLERAMEAGKTFVVRSGASFVKAVGRIEDRPLLTAAELLDKEKTCGGLVIIGSHVEKTTRQLESLRESGLPIDYVEFMTSGALVENGLEQEAARCLKRLGDSIASGRTAVVYTSREVLAPPGLSQEEILELSVQISDALTGMVGRLPVKPLFLIAKGGITSSDVGTKGLSVKRAVVMGQIRPGIPVWMTGSESRFPGLPYIIFPGNVGTVTDLRDIVEELNRN